MDKWASEGTKYVSALELDDFAKAHKKIHHKQKRKDRQRIYHVHAT